MVLKPKISSTSGHQKSFVGLLSRMAGNPSLVAGGMILGLVVVIAIVAPLVFNLDPYATDVRNRLTGPGFDHWLGTDNFGRDLFIRLLAGARTSMMLGAIVAVSSISLGAIIGILASFYSFLDQLLMRLCDGLMAIPGIMLAVALTASFGPSIPNLIIAMVIVFTPSVARVVRSRALAVKSETFVEASKAMGSGSLHIMRKHILPNTFSVMAVQGTFIFADTIITEAALSFLGAGVPTPEPSWGNILFDGKMVITRAPHMVILASIMLVTVVTGLNLLGDGLRDVIDKRGQNSMSPKFITRLFGFGRKSAKEVAR